jgi:hypothetical protein
MRMIAQFSEALGALIGLNRQRKPLEALEMAGELFKRLFGLNPSLVRALSERDLLDLLNREGEAPREKLLLMAELLKEEGELQGMLGREDERYRSCLKALNLALIASREEREEGAAEWPDPDRQIGELTEALSGYVLPNETMDMLWNHYASAGRFADAEDVLFELLETLEDVQGAEEQDEGASDSSAGADTLRKLLADAEQFYIRLLQLDRETLEKGRLPRDEAEEGLALIRAKLAGFAP